MLQTALRVSVTSINGKCYYSDLVGYYPLIFDLSFLGDLSEGTRVESILYPIISLEETFSRHIDLGEIFFTCKIFITASGLLPFLGISMVTEDSYLKRKKENHNFLKTPLNFFVNVG